MVIPGTIALKVAFFCIPGRYPPGSSFLLFVGIAVTYEDSLEIHIVTKLKCVFRCMIIVIHNSVRRTL